VHLPPLPPGNEFAKLTAMNDDHDPDFDDDEDWYDDGYGVELDDESAPCPECGAAVSSISDKCPACGCWITDADRFATPSGMKKPLWPKVTALVVLVTFLLGLAGFAAAIF
jgi:hypothetical protein